MTANDGSKLKNGEDHAVAGFTPEGAIRLDNGRVIPADAGHFRQGFVETSFGSQGKTVKRVILGMSSRSLPATNMEQLYVSASRAKASVTLYTDDKEAVKAAIGRSSQKLAALDIRPVPAVDEAAKRRQAKEEWQHRMRRHAYVAMVRASYDAPHQPQPTHQPERPSGHER